MLDESLNYKGLNNIITTIFEESLPNKSVASILKDEPFGLENTNLCDWQACSSEGVTLEDIKSIIEFCSLNNETFFKAFVIKYEEESYHIKKDAMIIIKYIHPIRLCYHLSNIILAI